MTTSTKRSSLRTSRRQEEAAGWLMAAPSLVILFVFMVIPALMALVYAFTDQRLVPGPVPTSFIGLRNFARIFSDEDFLQALRNNLYFTAVVVIVQGALALALAVLVNQRLRGVNAFRTAYFSPIGVTMVVVGVIWTLLFNRQGMINSALELITFGAYEPVDWLKNRNLAMVAIMVVSIWSSVGFQMIVFVAGLQEISPSLYEAAQVDGASPLQRFRYITIPQLRNTIIFVLVTGTIMSFRLYTQVEVMTQGGPQGSTNTMVRYMVDSGFKGLRIGYASAIAVIFLIIVLTVSLIQRRIVASEKM